MADLRDIVNRCFSAIKTAGLVFVFTSALSGLQPYAFSQDVAEKPKGNVNSLQKATDVSEKYSDTPRGEPIVSMTLDGTLDDTGPHHFKGTVFGEDMSFVPGVNNQAVFLGGDNTAVFVRPPRSIPYGSVTPGLCKDDFTIGASNRYQKRSGGLLNPGPALAVFELNDQTSGALLDRYELPVLLIAEPSQANQMPEPSLSTSATIDSQQPHSPSKLLSISTVKLKTTTLIINGRNSPYDFVLNNTSNETIPNIACQAWIEQGGVRSAAGGTLADCDTTKWPILAKGDATLELWFNLDPSGDENNLVAAAGGMNLSVDKPAGGPSWQLTGTIFTRRKGVSLSSEDKQVKPGEWTHAALVYNSRSKRAKLYLNGALVDKVAGAPAPPLPTTGHIMLGVYCGQHETFKGYIDEVKLYDYARSDKEIYEDYKRYEPVAKSLSAGH